MEVINLGLHYHLKWIQSIKIWKISLILSTCLHIFFFISLLTGKDLIKETSKAFYLDSPHRCAACRSNQSASLFFRVQCITKHLMRQEEAWRKVRMSRMYSEWELQALGSRSEDMMQKDKLLRANRRGTHTDTQSWDMQSRKGNHPALLPLQTHKETTVCFIPLWRWSNRVEFNIKSSSVLLCFSVLMKQSLVATKLACFPM